jgi:hypothetical protein
MTETAAAGAWLRSCRHAAELSQEKLAERAGLSVRAIRNLEHGRVPVFPPRIVAAARRCLSPARPGAGAVPHRSWPGAVLRVPETLSPSLTWVFLPDKAEQVRHLAAR